MCDPHNEVHPIAILKDVILSESILGYGFLDNVTLGDVMLGYGILDDVNSGDVILGNVISYTEILG